MQACRSCVTNGKGYWRSLPRSVAGLGRHSAQAASRILTACCDIEWVPAEPFALWMSGAPHAADPTQVFPDGAQDVRGPFRRNEPHGVPSAHICDSVPLTILAPPAGRGPLMFTGTAFEWTFAPQVVPSFVHRVHAQVVSQAGLVTRCI